jgi:Mn-dependent DtxR family transcriptional regulator
MSQEDIIRYLKRKKKASSNEIAEALDISMRAVTKCLKTLFKYDEVDKINVSKDEFMEMGFKSKSYNGRIFLWRLKD